MLNRVYEFRLSNNYIYYIIFAYYFLLSLLIVTKYYGIINYLSLVVSFFCLINLKILRKEQRSFFLIFYPLQLFILLINLFFVQYQQFAFLGLMSLMKNVITALLPALFIIDIKKLKYALLSVVTGGLINSVFNINSGLDSLYTGVRYITEDINLSLNSLAHATLLYLMCSFILYHLMNKKKFRFLMMLTIVILIISILIIGSRQALISIIGFIVIYFLLKINRFSFKKITIFLFSILSLLLVSKIIIYYIPDSPLVRRLTDGINLGDETRLYFFKQAWELFKERPFSGYGIDTFRFFSRYVYTHSTYSELIFTGGIFYTFLYLLFYGKYITYNFKRIYQVNDIFVRNLYVLILAFNIAILINGMFYLVHASRLALTIQFFLINFLFSTGSTYKQKSENI